MPFYQLPQELLYAIVSYLDDYLSLRACALTCRALISPAQARLWRSIDIAGQTPVVLAKLESTPHIRTFIKHLRLIEIHRPWIQRSEELHRMLNLLSPYTTSLYILQRTRKPTSPRFDLSSLSLLRCLEEISLREEQRGESQPRNTYGDDALPAFLNHFPKLRAITFDQCLVQNQSIDSKNDISTPVFQLESLDVSCCLDTLVLDWLVPALKSLKRLCLQYPDRDSFFRATMPQYITTANSSLQNLEVRGSEDAFSADIRPLMTAVKTHSVNLRSLSLMLTDYISENSLVNVLVQSLLLIGPRTYLQHLTIGVCYPFIHVDGTTWDDLQDLLLGTRFPALRSVEVRLLVTTNLDSTPIFTEPFLAVVPQLVQKGMVRVTHRRFNE